jgi:ERCC4-type nuclease
MPREFLKRVPGVTSHNIQKIIEKVKNLVELVNLSIEEITEIIGQESQARLIYSFFNTKISVKRELSG